MHKNRRKIVNTVFKNHFIHSQQCIKIFLRISPLLKMVQCVKLIYTQDTWTKRRILCTELYNSILSHKGVKRIFCTHRRERVHKAILNTSVEIVHYTIAGEARIIYSCERLAKKLDGLTFPPETRRSRSCRRGCHGSLEPAMVYRSFYHEGL